MAGKSIGLILFVAVIFSIIYYGGLIAGAAVISLLFDVMYFIRSFAEGLYARIFHSDDMVHPLSCVTYRSFVWTSDLDWLLHMNNARYSRECDFGRLRLWLRSGLWKEFQKRNCGVVLGGSTTRFRRSLGFLQRFIMTTQIVGWDNRSWYIEQRMRNSEGFVCAVVFTKSVLLHRSKNPDTQLTPSYFMNIVSGEESISPDLPAEVKAWIKFNDLSSESLRKTGYS